jgi:hypothetical protein
LNALAQLRFANASHSHQPFHSPYMTPLICLRICLRSTAETAKGVLSATLSRSSVPRQPLASPMLAPKVAPTQFVPVKPSAAAVASAAAAAAARRESADGPSRNGTTRPFVQTQGTATTASAGSAAYFPSDGDGAGGRPRSPELRRLRAQMLSDPEPEKVLGLVEQVRASEQPSFFKRARGREPQLHSPAP